MLSFRVEPEALWQAGTVFTVQNCYNTNTAQLQLVQNTYLRAVSTPPIRLKSIQQSQIEVIAGQQCRDNHLLIQMLLIMSISARSECSSSVCRRCPSSSLAA